MTDDVPAGAGRLRGATRAELEQLRAWNATARPLPPPGAIPTLVAARARCAPGALAVADGARRLTYAELDRRAGRLARAVRQVGGGPDVPIALALERSADMVAAALGVLRAGAAYVPLDPSYPAERLAFMLDDARPAAVITVGRVAQRLPRRPCPVLLLDHDAGEDPAEPPADVAIDDRSLAYVVYTSGSTGRPKGVEITHAGLRNLVHWHRRAFGVTAADRAALLASPGFDAAVWEVWPALVAGAALLVVDDATRLDAERLRDWLVAHAVTIAFVPTPLAERLVALEWPAATALRVLLTGADTLHRYPPPGLPFTLVNNYGPSEATVVATSGVVAPAGCAGRRPPIGRPIDNVQAWILDEHRRPVGIGVAGELHVGGVGVARGYRNQPDLTARRFVADPFGGEPGARLYRTGDRARWLPDGQIEFLGRLDDQIKVRGHRVEPDEIVAALNAHPGVAASAAVARRDGAGDAVLAAYVVARDGAALTASGLRDTLRATLPDHMVPSVFVRVPALPLTPNGKVDRAALPPPDEAATLRDADPVPPRTPVEAGVAAILASLLGLAEVSVDDNFFLLGGHSLLGTQLVSRLREAFGVDLPLRTVFDRPTVAALAEEIERTRDARAAAGGPSARPRAA